MGPTLNMLGQRTIQNRVNKGENLEFLNKVWDSDAGFLEIQLSSHLEAAEWIQFACGNCLVCITLMKVPKV